jgi:hypothetical protein
MPYRIVPFANLPNPGPLRKGQMQLFYGVACSLAGSPLGERLSRTVVSLADGFRVRKVSGKIGGQRAERCEE